MRKRAFIPIILLALCAFPYEAFPQKVRLKLTTKTANTGKNKIATQTAKNISGDSILWEKIDGTPVMTLHPDSIKFVGYDKQLSADKESIILINKTKKELKGAEIKITYLTTSGEMLHSRNVKLWETIPAGESRKIDFPSWDPQHTFYYRLSNRPRNRATPYSISISLISFTL